MTKLEADKKRKKPQHIDFFIQTPHVSNTARGIKQLYDTTQFTCVTCKERNVETKMAVCDVTGPTFTLYRKRYCIQCWLKLVMI